ncbi:hypothetical protein BDV96DRAFT_652916 [Lophiotrema nucula]|uniref:Uncharacterized protein n=1 Tax=Lophiotrema nucula TaxID=690887 RepID=A0A6A5YQE7_9PLEO|nr:hypothetical protein BDV96DRAFT_652916 [Lophiotrema nucula]
MPAILASSLGANLEAMKRSLSDPETASQLIQLVARKITKKKKKSKIHGGVIAGIVIAIIVVVIIAAIILLLLKRRNRKRIANGARV